MSSTTTNSRVALQPISDSALNAKLLTTSLTSNLKSIIDRTPQLKRSFTVEIGSLSSPSFKKLCNEKRESVLPSPVSTPKFTSSFSPKKRSAQASVLKARLQMAYYKIKHQKTMVSSTDLITESFKNETRQYPLFRSFQNPNTRTPIPKKASDLLASSTPIPVSIFKTTTGKKNSMKSVSFKAAESLRHPFLPQISYTSSSPSKFVTSLPASAMSTIPKPSLLKNQQSNNTSTLLQLLLKKRTLKAPSLKKNSSIKLPSLYEVTSNINTSTPLPAKPVPVVTITKPATTSELPLSKENLFTPIKSNKKKSHTSFHDDSTQLMSSPSKLMTTPSSMGAAKSLLQLGIVKKE